MSNNLLTMLAVMEAIAPNGLGSDPFYTPNRKPPKDPTSEESIKKLEAAEAKRKRRAARTAQADSVQKDAAPEILDIPEQCPYFGPSPHRDVWLDGRYATLAAQKGSDEIC